MSTISSQFPTLFALDHLSIPLLSYAQMSIPPSFSSDAVHLSTFRRVHPFPSLEHTMDEVRFADPDFNIRSLLRHITHASLPDIVSVLCES